MTVVVLHSVMFVFIAMYVGDCDIRAACLALHKGLAASLYQRKETREINRMNGWNIYMYI